MLIAKDILRRADREYETVKREKYPNQLAFTAPELIRVTNSDGLVVLTSILVDEINHELEYLKRRVSSLEKELIHAN